MPIRTIGRPIPGDGATKTDPTTIDEDVPIVVRKQTDVAAPLERVRALHADPAGYPAWQHSIVASRTDGPFAPGGSFTWTSHGFTVLSHLHAVDEPRRTLRGGSSGGVTGIHEWRFTPIPGGTRVATDESWSGPVVLGAVEDVRSALDGSLDAWLTSLRSAAEPG